MAGRMSREVTVTTGQAEAVALLMSAVVIPSKKSRAAPKTTTRALKSLSKCTVPRQVRDQAGQ